jgi:hypothetical protein
MGQRAQRSNDGINCIKVYADDAPLPDNRSLQGE